MQRNHSAMHTRKPRPSHKERRIRNVRGVPVTVVQYVMIKWKWGGGGGQNEFRNDTMESVSPKKITQRKVCICMCACT